MMTEHFAMTTNGVSYGRSGVSSNDWDKVIVARNQAILNCSFKGFLTYAWAKNGMLVSDDEIIHFEDTYRTNTLPTNFGLTAPYIIIQPQSQISATVHLLFCSAVPFMSIDG